MASDIVERLRERATSYRTGGPSSEHTATMQTPAAEIERLNRELDDVWNSLSIQREDNASFGDAFKRMTAEIERLRAALKDIRDHSLELYATGVARAALAEEKKR